LISSINTIKNRNTTRHFGSPYPSKVNLAPEYQQFAKKEEGSLEINNREKTKCGFYSKTTQFYRGRGACWVFERASTVGASLLKMFTVITLDILQK